MFHIILLCTILVHILAGPVPDDEDVIHVLARPPDTVLNHQEIEAWVAAMKTLKDTSLTKAERKEKLAKDLESVPLSSPHTVDFLVEASDYQWKLIKGASAKVREVYNKSHDLQSDPKLYKMSSKERRAEGEKLYNTLSDAEKEEMKEILIKAAVQMKELNREYQRTREEDHTYLSE